MGLVRAFSNAGVREVVAYRGKVPDSFVTLEFVEAFYESYLSTGEAETALASAQRRAASANISEEFWSSYFVTKSSMTDFQSK